MKTYAELGHVYRGDPCVEYPGEWLVYTNGGDEKSFPSYEETFKVARKQSDSLEDLNVKVSICWKCSDNDPRQGQVWFTGFYQHGYFGIYGSYVQ